MPRITEMSEATGLSNNDYVLIDSPTKGTRKYLASNFSQGGGGGGGTTYIDLFELLDSANLQDVSNVNHTYTVDEDGIYLVGMIMERRGEVSTNSITGDFTELYSYTTLTRFNVKVISAVANTVITFTGVTNYNRVRYFVVKINKPTTSVTALYEQCYDSETIINYNPSSLTVTGKALIIQIDNFDDNAATLATDLPVGVMTSYLPIFWKNRTGESIRYDFARGQIILMGLDDLSGINSIYIQGGNWGSTGLIILDLI